MSARQRAFDALRALLALSRLVPVAPINAEQRLQRDAYDYVFDVLQDIADTFPESPTIWRRIVDLCEQSPGAGVFPRPSFEQFVQMRVDGDVGREATRSITLPNEQDIHAHELLNVRLVGVHHHSVLLRLHELEQDRFLVRVQTAQQRKPLAFDLDLRPAPPPPDEQPA